ncbi:hypothetical protein SAMN05216483_6278 [Streptomyces sp. 2131.1]|uniref:hypothetical protein n=1 Tax=Streptomyces sp. 2131.1 TaxID=1855346 RepID=UPI000895D546|nr:hypothetical protein [Streptomyces sp. 2131.1]SEE45767.1 hypothetical protein SAMN05216483_6278 [Streptomyces sp. 2131.1]
MIAAMASAWPSNVPATLGGSIKYGMTGLEFDAMLEARVAADSCTSGMRTEDHGN